MTRYFDIQPPRPKPTPATTPKPRQKKGGWGWFLIVIFLGVFAVFGLKMPGAKVTSDRKSETKTQSDNFELFDQSGQSNLSNEKTLAVRILDASGGDKLAQIEKHLSVAGIKVEQSSKTETLSGTAVIYYKKDKLTDAQKVQNALKGSLEVKLEESETLGQSYDCLIVLTKP